MDENPDKMSFMEALAAFEGFGASPNNRPTRNNNPGDIEWGHFARENGATRIEEIPTGYLSTPRFAYFPTPEAGWRALKELLQTRYKGFTVEETMSKFAPAVENEVNTYIKFICLKVGCKPSTIIDELL